MVGFGDFARNQGSIIWKQVSKNYFVTQDIHSCEQKLRNNVSRLSKLLVEIADDRSDEMPDVPEVPESPETPEKSVVSKTSSCVSWLETKTTLSSGSIGFSPKP